MDSDLLFNRLLNDADEEDYERTLVRLIHASFEDEKITVSYFASEDVRYKDEWFEPGALGIEDYTIERRSPGTYRVRLTASYSEMLPDNSDEADFHAPVESEVVYNLVVQCSEDFHTGQGKVFVAPTTERKA